MEAREGGYPIVPKHSQALNGATGLSRTDPGMSAFISALSLPSWTIILRIGRPSSSL